MENEFLAIYMGLGFFVLLFIGFPVGIALAASGLLFGYIGFGMTLFNLLPQRIFGLMENYTLMAIPLFVFIGVMLERSRIAEELLDVIGHAAGTLRGGMGLAMPYRFLLRSFIPLGFLLLGLQAVAQMIRMAHALRERT